MKRIFLMFLAAALFVSASISGIGSAQADGEWSAFDYNFRTIPALGFFPLGGNADIKSGQLATYVGGIGFDLGRYNTDDKSAVVFNLQPYLVGVDWTALGKAQTNGSEEKTAKFVNMAYVRAGPVLSYKLKDIEIGGQFGYAVTLLSEDPSGKLYRTVRYLHGLDVSACVTWHFQHFMEP
jgi:hypothetical protein